MSPGCSGQTSILRAGRRTTILARAPENRPSGRKKLAHPTGGEQSSKINSVGRLTTRRAGTEFCGVQPVMANRLKTVGPLPAPHLQGQSPTVRSTLRKLSGKPSVELSGGPKFGSVINLFGLRNPPKPDSCTESSRRVGRPTVCSEKWQTSASSARITDSSDSCGWCWAAYLCAPACVRSSHIIYPTLRSIWKDGSVVCLWKKGGRH